MIKIADVKWIKIVTDVFDNRKIKQIDRMPEADAILVIWFKILCLSGEINENGFIMLTKDIPYTDEMLATAFNKPVNIIRLALKTYEHFGMIELVDNVYRVSNWEKYQSVDRMEKLKEKTKLRVARHRELKKPPATECNVTVTLPVTQSNATDKTKSKTKKEKEIKNTYSEFVTMTTTEHDRLVNEFGQDAVNRMIEILNNYKGSKGAKYASDNLAIRSWVIKRYQEEQNQTKLFADKPKMSKREQQLDELGRIMDDYDRCNSQKATDDVFCELPEPW